MNCSYRLVCVAMMLVSMAGLTQAQGDSTHATPSRPDSVPKLGTVTVTAPRTVRAIDVPPPVSRGIVYAGKTVQIVHVDSTSANTGRDISRDIIGRIPGVNIAETEAAGFPSNGIGFRGLNPTQSIEMNVRQDGVNIAGDLYGYNETYYSPPSELIDDILVLRGASALAYGPQFGGAIDYILKQGTPNSPPAVDLRQSAGSFGLFDTFGSVGGGTGPVTYFAAVDHRNEQGWRPNSDYDQTDAYARVDYAASPSTSIGLEYTRFRDRIHMAGGLTDAEFDADPQSSYRSRNWLAAPWNILEGHLTSRLSDRLRLYVTSSLMLSQRYLVWRNEDGGAQVADTIDPATDAFVPREVERERFYNFTNEARLQLDHSLFHRVNTLAAGVRVFTGNMERQEGGPGSTGSDFNMNVYGGPFETDLHFGTTNVALFAENLLHITDRWSVTPGMRVEWLRSTIDGVRGLVDIPAQQKDRVFGLAGIGTEYLLGPASTLYANATQAYRPITYDALTPFGSTSRISPDLKDGHGYDLDIGWRGTPVRGLTASVTAFYLWYDNREGLYSGIDTAAGSTFTEEATIGTSVAQGVEAYVAVTPFAVAGTEGPLAGLSVFDAAAYDDSHYVSGAFDGKQVELAPAWINRIGVSYAFGPTSTTFQLATQTHSFTDANNTVRAPDDAGIGVIPGYSVVDWSIDATIARRYRVWLGINNLTNVWYFTQRTTEYPGPGIIPSPTRSLTFGVSFASGH